jgi:hypothetical protein
MKWSRLLADTVVIMGDAVPTRAAHGATARAQLKQPTQERTRRQKLQIAREVEAETSQCRNRGVCETFNFETSVRRRVPLAPSIRCFFSSLIEHNHLADWHLAQSEGKAA